MKTREEYLLRYEDQLLALITEHIASVNHTMFFVYVVAAVDLLVVADLAALLPFFNFRFDGKAPENLKPLVATCAPAIIGLTLCYCVYGLYMIRKGLSRFTGNGKRLWRENPAAKPITRASIRLRRAGLVGMGLYLGRKLVEFFSRKGSKQGWWRTPFAMAGLLLTLLYLGTIFLLPVYLGARCYLSAGERTGLGMASFGLMVVSAVLLTMVIGQLIIRDALAFIDELGDRKSVV